MAYYDQTDEDHQHKDTPQEALIVALGKCELEYPFKEVLCIWNTKSGKSGSCDSGLNTSEAGWLCCLFMIWLANANLGVVMGAVKERLFEHVGLEEDDGKGNDKDPSR